MNKKTNFALLIVCLSTLLLTSGCSLYKKQNSSPTGAKETVDQKIEALKTILANQYGKNKVDLTVVIKQESENHVRGIYQLAKTSGSTNGGLFLATKINNQWQIVYNDDGPIICEKMAVYKFPKNMISDCIASSELEAQNQDQ